MAVFKAQMFIRSRMPPISFKPMLCYQTITNGNVVVNDIKIGDIHYMIHYYNIIKCEVITLPHKDDKGYWSWKSKNCNTTEIINYGITEKLEHYSKYLYTEKYFNEIYKPQIDKKHLK